MKRDLLDLVPRPQNVLRRLRGFAVGSALTGVSLFGVSSASATAVVAAQDQARLTPTIVDRSKKTAKLILRLPGRIGSYMVQHRSHASHASHASHYSGTSGGTAVAPAAPPRPAAPAPIASAPAAPVTVPENLISGAKFESFDRINKTIKIKDAVGAVMEFSWRDDTKLISVDLNSLLENVFVAPKCEQSFEDALRALRARYGLLAPICHSSLTITPLS